MSPFRTQSSDTDPEIERRQFEIWRRMSPADKLDRVFDLIATARRVAATGIRARHPDADDREVFLRLCSTWVDRDTMIRAYGWDPAAAES